MNTQCARCRKTVYPVEKLNCLDKIWHKKCFKCEVCRKTLNMKNYKGYDKKPYCQAHYPATTKATLEADKAEKGDHKASTQQQSQPPVQPMQPKDCGLQPAEYIAISEYTAADNDEVSFMEGDVVIDANVIDEEWMEGCVQRTGQL